MKTNVTNPDVFDLVPQGNSATINSKLKDLSD